MSAVGRKLLIEKYVELKTDDVLYDALNSTSVAAEVKALVELVAEGMTDDALLCAVVKFTDTKARH